MNRSVVLSTVVRAEVPVLLVVSAYLLFAGHNQPGGGFSGGLVAGAAFALQSVAGVPVIRPRLRASALLGWGLLLAVVTAFVPLAAGRALLDHGAVSLDLPVLGTVKVTSALPFDTGVYLVVLGLVLLVLDVFDAPAADEEAS